MLTAVDTAGMPKSMDLKTMKIWGGLLNDVITLSNLQFIDVSDLVNEK